MSRIRMALATLAMAVFATLALATPAQAAPTQELYVTVTSYGDTLNGWFWVDEQQGIIGCARCGWWFDFDKSARLSQSAEATVYRDIMTGLDYLGQAGVATDPNVIARLRADALNAFTGGARALGQTSLSAGAVGYYDPGKRQTVTADEPWLKAADKALASGMEDLHTSFFDPEPAPWVTAAIAQFDLAFTQISEKKVIA